MHEPLPLALAAGVPLIRVANADALFLPTILNALRPATKQLMEEPVGRKNYTHSAIYYSFLKTDRGLTNWASLYRELEAKESSLVLTGDEHEKSPLVFDAGPLPVPTSVLREIVAQWKPGDEAIVRSLAGVPLPLAVSVLRMATIKGDLNARTVTRLLRQTSALPPGLEAVHRVLPPGYRPEPGIARWVRENRIFFEKRTMLTPRGLLFVGPPGTGKSLAAKYVARKLRLSLYRYDVGSSLSKYLGESEAALRTALHTIEQSAPCVFLLDEAEKIFSERTDQDTHRNILAVLLWWMQEHRSAVLTVATSNHPQSLPPELVRAGRLDGTFRFELLDRAGQRALADSLVAAYPAGARPLARVALPLGERASHAEVAQAVLESARKRVRSERQNRF